MTFSTSYMLYFSFFLFALEYLGAPSLLPATAPALPVPAVPFGAIRSSSIPAFLPYPVLPTDGQ